MFRNYWLVTFRNLTHNKVFSLVNVLCLSVGISAALAIYMVVSYEWSFDRFQPDRNRIFRVVLDMKRNGETGHSGAVPAALSGAIRQDVPGVEATAPIMQFQGDATANIEVPASDGQDKIVKKQHGVVFTSADYFRLLPYRWLAGSARSSLNDPFTVVLTESHMRQYFPKQAIADVIGKRLTYNRQLPVTVTGIVADLPEQTDFLAQEFISLPTIYKTTLQEDFMMNRWDDWMAYSSLYLKLTPGAHAPAIQRRINQLLKKFAPDANADSANTMTFLLQPLNNVHFNADYAAYGQRTADKPTLYALMSVALFLLLSGCINFINLATARATERAKEIGIRKTMGSSVRQLRVQFLTETFLLTLLATALSIISMPLVLRLFAELVPEGVTLQMLFQWPVFIFLLLMIPAVSALAGLYPAMILSRFSPVSVLPNIQSTRHRTAGAATIRKALTIVQLTMALFLILATAVVTKQLHYAADKDLGFRKEAIINFSIPFDPVKAKSDRLLSVINHLPGVQLVSRGFLPPAIEGVAMSNIAYTSEQKQAKANVQVRMGDSNYLQVYQIRLAAGRNILQNPGTREALINETYGRVMGFSDLAGALGKLLTGEDGKTSTIVGVMKDFHERSLHVAIDPIVFQSADDGAFFHVCLRPPGTGSMTWQRTIGQIRQAYQALYPEEEFNYSFFDESIARFYLTEQRTAGLLTVATGIAVLISALGLLGLVIFSTQTRTREIGVRRVLGASVAAIVFILSADLLRLAMIAFAIAAPVAGWFLSRWLQQFAYRTTLDWWIFALGGICLVLFMLVILGFQILKTAMANPVKSLRSE